MAFDEEDEPRIRVLKEKEESLREEHVKEL